MEELPVFEIDGKLYFWDKRLYQYREVDNPFNIIDGNKVDEDDNMDVKLVELNNGNV